MINDNLDKAIFLWNSESSIVSSTEIFSEVLRMYGEKTLKELKEVLYK